MTQAEMFILASKCFSLMTPIEQGLTLIFFNSSKDKGKSITDRWIDACSKVAESMVDHHDKPNESQR